MLFRSAYIVSRIKADNEGTLKDKEVQLIGVAYKPNVSDVRETPAELIIEKLLEEGAKVSWHDPIVENWKGESSQPLGAEISIIVTLHDVLEPIEILKSSKYVFDTTGKVFGAHQL